MNKWSKKNALWMLLYVVLYASETAVVCFTGAIHPIMFVCYQITAGILLSGIVIHAFRRIQAPGVAVCFSLGVIALFFIIQDASAWHCLPLVVMGVLAEMVRAAMKYNWTGDVIATMIMTFSTFGFYGQIWFNRAFTYEAAVEEMPAGYAEGLMAVSPVWAFTVVVVIGLALSAVICNVTAKLFKVEKS